MVLGLWGLFLLGLFFGGWVVGMVLGDVFFGGVQPLGDRRQPPHLYVRLVFIE